MRRRGVAGAVVAVAVAVLVAGDAGAGRSGGHAKAWADGTPIVWTDEEMPALPLDAYAFDGGDARAYDEVDSARRVLAQRCMVRHGFAGFPRDPGIRTMAVTHTTVMVAVATGPVGLLDLEQARRWGYGQDPAASLAPPEPTGRMMTAEESDVYYGDPQGDRTGCEGEADRTLERGTADRERMWSYVPEREAAVSRLAARVPRLRRAYETWAACVTGKGFKRYADPDQAFGDRAWGRGQDGNTTRSATERGTAVADVACKRAHNTGGVWWSVTRRLQRRELALHQAEFATVRADRDRLLAHARAVLRTA
ncbi:hypothetical protein [Streptomyces sp. NPDC006552]|uniref:hypothetical protein n=1 Tax=Streptomyces sp. NPDC006552 TaxID=3157179 RepID=UPI0033B4BFBE